MTVPAFTDAPIYTVSGTGPYGVLFGYGAGTLRATIFAADGTRTALSPSDFSVVPAASDSVGSVFLSSAAAALHDGARLLIERETPADQSWVGVAGERERGLETQLDATTRAVQELQAQMRRTLRGTAAYPTFDPIDGRALIFSGGAFESGPSVAAIEDAAAAAASAIAAAAAAQSAAQDAIAAEAGITQLRPRFVHFWSTGAENSITWPGSYTHNDLFEIKVGNVEQLPQDANGNTVYTLTTDGLSTTATFTQPFPPGLLVRVKAWYQVAVPVAAADEIDLASGETALDVLTSASRSYPTRSDAVAAIASGAFVPVTGQTYWIDGIPYRGAPLVVSVLPGLPGLLPGFTDSGGIYAACFGAVEDYDDEVPEGGTNDGPAIQAAADWLALPRGPKGDNAGGAVIIRHQSVTDQTIVLPAGVRIEGKVAPISTISQVGGSAWPMTYAEGSKLVGRHTAGPVVRVPRSDAGTRNITIGATPARRAAAIATGVGNVNCGVLYETPDTAGAISLFAFGENTLVRDQPADGILISGAVEHISLTRTAVINVGRHGYAFDDGQYSGRTNKVRQGMIILQHCRAANTGGHSFAIGHPASGINVPYRVYLLNVEGIRAGNTPALLHAPAGSYLVGEQVVVDISASSGTSGTSGNAAALAHAWAMTGRSVYFRGTRFIGYTQEPALILTSPWQASGERANIWIEGGHAATTHSPYPVRFFKIESGAHVDLRANDLSGNYNSEPVDPATPNLRAIIEHKAGGTIREIGFSRIHGGGLRQVGPVNFRAEAPPTTVIASGAVPAGTLATITLDTEGAAATDELHTIDATGVAVGEQRILRTLTNARDVLITDAGNIRGAFANFWLRFSSSRVIVEWDGTNWQIVGLSLHDAELPSYPRGDANELSVPTDGAGRLTASVRYRVDSAHANLPVAAEGVIDLMVTARDPVRAVQVFTRQSDGAVWRRTTTGGTLADPTWSAWTADVRPFDLLQLPVVRVLAADQTVNNTTTPVTINDISAPVVAGGTYLFELVATAIGDSTADIRLQPLPPSGSSAYYAPIGSLNVATTGVPAVRAGETGAVILFGTEPASPRTFALSGIVTIGGTSGSLDFRFAQATAVAADLTVQGGRTWSRVTRIA